MGRRRMSEGQTIECLQFFDVSNAAAVRKRVMKGEFNCALVDASMVMDIFHVQQSAHKALQAQIQGTMTTRTLGTEIIYNMAATKSIKDALNDFGISKESK